jgi:hypothetical protein
MGRRANTTLPTASNMPVHHPDRSPQSSDTGDNVGRSRNQIRAASELSERSPIPKYAARRDNACRSRNSARSMVFSGGSHLPE